MTTTPKELNKMSKYTYHTLLVAFSEILKGRMEVRCHRQTEIRSRFAAGGRIILTLASPRVPHNAVDSVLDDELFVEDRRTPCI